MSVSAQATTQVQTATIKDVAALAGVSMATASRVLSGSPATSPQARKDVNAAAKKLNFRHNAQARSLRSTKTNTIGLLVSDVRNPFFADLAHAVEQTALRSGYVVLLGNANESEEQQDRYLDNVISQRVDGVIIAPQGQGKGSLAELIERRIPTVFVDRTVDGINVPSVTTDSRAGIEQAVAHLKSQGHTRIGYISGPQSTSTGRDRFNAYTIAIAQAGMDQDPQLIYFGDFQSASGSAGIEALLKLPQPPTAILAADSPMAIGAISKLQTLKKRIGHEIALIAFDDIEWFSLFTPPLSVISHDVEKMGTEAITLLLKIMDNVQNNDPAPASITLASELIVRASSLMTPRSA